MKSHTLKFQMLHGYNWLQIEFETESRERNLLMEVVLGDYHLDTSTLHQYNPELYKEIKAAMKNNADSFWEDEAPQKSPILNAFDMILKNSFSHLMILLLLLLPAFSNAQVNMELGAGIGNHKPIAKIEIGYQAANVNVAVMMQPTISRSINSKMYFGMKAGYNVHNIIPSIGYYYNYASADNKDFNGFVGIGYSLKYILIMNENGGLYAEGNYIINRYK